MKSKEDIEQLAKTEYPIKIGGSMWMPNTNDIKKSNKQEGYIKGYTQCQEDMIKEELKDWDVTLNDGLEDEPYVSDDFQIGPDGAYEHTEDMTPKEKAKDELIKVLYSQVIDLTMMSKIELGDAVIAEIKRLQDIIDKPNTKEELDLWCNYSNMLSPMAYIECEYCGELKSVCECIHEEKIKQQTEI